MHVKHTQHTQAHTTTTSISIKHTRRRNNQHLNKTNTQTTQHNTQTIKRQKNKQHTIGITRHARKHTQNTYKTQTTAKLHTKHTTYATPSNYTKQKHDKQKANTKTRITQNAQQQLTSKHKTHNIQTKQTHHITI